MPCITALFVLRPSAQAQRSSGDPLLPLDHVGHRCLGDYRHWRSGDEEKVTSPQLWNVRSERRDLTRISHRDSGGQAKACAAAMFALENDVIVPGLKGW